MGKVVSRGVPRFNEYFKIAQSEWVRRVRRLCARRERQFGNDAMQMSSVWGGTRDEEGRDHHLANASGAATGLCTISETRIEAGTWVVSANQPAPDL